MKLLNNSKIQLNKDSKLIINFLASIIQMILNYSISFFLTPFLVSTVGKEAYGFLILANNMVNYASVLTVALSSVGGRYITISIHKDKIHEANEYFNSVLYSNAIIGGVMVLVFAPIIYKIDMIFDVPSYLVKDVRVLFCFVILNFILTVIGNVFNVATFITNQLYLTNVGNCVSSMLRAVLLYLMFGNLPTNIAYVAETSFLCTILLTIYNWGLTHKLTPLLKINHRYYSILRIRELISSGIWSSLTKLSQILSDGLDLVLCNIALDAVAMGSLSVAYTIPTLLAGLLGTITGVFSPQQTYYYAINNTQAIVKNIKLNMKMMGFFVAIIISGFIIYGKEFFMLWTPTEDIVLIYRLSVVACSSVIVSGVTIALTNVFLLTNNLKINSLVYLAISFFDIVCAYVLVKTTSLGVYAIAGVSKVVGIIVSVTYLPIYAAKCLGISKATFYPDIIKYLLCTLVIMSEMKFFEICMKEFTTDWWHLIIKILVSGSMAAITNFIIYLNRDERKYVLSLLSRRAANKNNMM